jgi:hypothetical protein
MQNLIYRVTMIAGDLEKHKPAENTAWGVCFIVVLFVSALL